MLTFNQNNELVRNAVCKIMAFVSLATQGGVM